MKLYVILKRWYKFKSVYQNLTGLSFDIHFGFFYNVKFGKLRKTAAFVKSVSKDAALTLT